MQGLSPTLVVHDGGPAHDTIALMSDVRALRDRLSGDVVLPGDETWDVARQAWNLAAVQQPVAVVYAESADDVVATVRYAAEHDLRIAFIAGGHNAGTIDWSRETLLLKTERMGGISIDPAARRAQVEAGVLARPLAVAAGEHGLAYLAGTSPDVGVLGYALGGGLSWLVRKHGLACNTIISADVVAADGRLRHIDHEHDPDLFWAIRGGSGNVAAVTAIEVELFPISEVYGGCLFWPIERATEILGAWRAWIEDVPEECESLGRMLQLPELPFLPPHLSGRSFVLVEAVFVGSQQDGAALLQPLRDLGPQIDTFAMLPPAELSTINMDPEMPLPYAGDGILLDDLPPAAIDSIVASFVGSPLLHVEVRQLGGAAARSAPEYGILDAIEQPYVTFTFGLAPTPEALAAVEHQAATLLAGLAPWDSGRRYLNFAETRVAPESIFGAEATARLREIKALWDAAGVFLANHPV